ncbi:MAG: M23 family metallopeptidase [Cellulosilyticaceae bacterium]
MSLERLIREQVYKYKRRQYLRKSNVDKISDSQFIVFNMNKPNFNKSIMRGQKSSVGRESINKSARNIKLPRRSSSRSHRARSFYGSPINAVGGRHVAGLICIILAIILILTQCFNGKVQLTMASQEGLSTALEEPSMNTQKENVVLENTQVNSQEELGVSKPNDKKKHTSTLQTYYESIQNFNMEAKSLDKLFDVATKNKREYSQALAIWSIGKLQKSTDKEIYQMIRKYDHEYMMKNYPRYEEGESIYKQFVYDIKYFPIPKYKKYNFESSWQEKVLFEESDSYGIDIIDPKNTTGKIPVVSMTEGVVEGLGWHEIGGYRVGIRSEGGAYFYYGHLDELPTHIQKGDTVQAGDYLGMMGNTGYGAEGTRGEIPVKLHVGIAVSAKDGKQFWVNPYPFLGYVESNKTVIKP